MNRMLECVFDVFYGDTPIGGASAVLLHDRPHILTAFHISHDTKKGNAPRAIILRSCDGSTTLSNIVFHKVQGSDDLALSDPVQLIGGFPVAESYIPNDSFITIGTPVSLIAEHRVRRKKSVADPVPMNHAPKYITLTSKGQQIARGFSGKPVFDSQEYVIAVLTHGRPGRTKPTGFAETLRLPIFR